MKLSLLKTLSLGVAAGAISMCGVAHAQTTDSTTMDSTTMDSSTTTTMTTVAPPATNMPMAVSGTVLRYYVNRSGYVTAMDVQTADGVRLVRFSPSMAQNLTSMYPVGSTASVFVTSTPMSGMTRYDLAGMGAEMPSPTAMMMPVMISDVDLLKSEPFTTVGAQPTRVAGKLTGFVSDPMGGEVLALVLDNNILVRVPRENRLVGSMNSNMTTPLARGAQVVAYGLPEAPRFGAVSPYTTRLIGTGIAVNGRNVGPLGFGMMKMGKKDTLLGFNLFGGTISPEETSAMNSGFMTYSTPGMSSGSMGTGMGGSMGTGMDSTMSTPGTDAATTPAPSM